MKSTNFYLIRFDADDGMVFDWAEPRYETHIEDGKEVQVQAHLYAKTLFIGPTDNIANYVEVEAIKEVAE